MREQGYVRRQKSLFLVLATSGLLSMGSSRCVLGGKSSDSDTLSQAATSSVPGGPRFVRVKFTNVSPGVNQTGGSFSTTNASGTMGSLADPGTGLRAVRFFDERDNELQLSQVPWIEYVAVSQLGECYKFENSAPSGPCQVGSNSTTTCGGPNNFLRVSEAQCASGSGSVPGTNGPVYIAAKFRRSGGQLAPHENIQVGLTYTASIPNATQVANQCFELSGEFKPELCSYFAYRAFLMGSDPTPPAQPFKLVIPPTTNIQTNLPGTRRLGTTTQMFVLPMAYNSMEHLIIQRNAGPTTVLSGTCTGNSPLCAGVIWVDMTLTRM